MALDGLNVAFATRYHDDEPGSPWSFVCTWTSGPTPRSAMRSNASTRVSSAATRSNTFPWAWKESRRVAVRPVEIEVSHEPRRQWLRIRDHVSVRIRDAWAGPETVTCVIPGHHRSGEELVADELRVDDGPLRFEYHGNCGYGTTFDYAG